MQWQSLPVGEDGELDGIAGGCHCLLVLLRMDLNPDVCVGRDQSCALRIHHDCADLVQQDGRARDPVVRP